MDKWIIRLDLAGQKDPETILNAILIVVEYDTGKTVWVLTLKKSIKAFPTQKYALRA